MQIIVQITCKKTKNVVTLQRHTIDWHAQKKTTVCHYESYRNQLFCLLQFICMEKLMYNSLNHLYQYD